MKKIFQFSSQPELLQYEELADLKSSFEVITNEQNLTPQQVLAQDFKIIELGAGDFEKFLPYFSALDVKVSHLLVADTLVRQGSIYRPMNILPEAVYSTVTDKVPKLKVSEPAVVVADYDFALAMTYKLAQSGFLKVIIANDDVQSRKKIKSIIQQFVFGVEVVGISLEELTELDSTNGLLILNLRKEKNPEAHESITYFNFLTPNAVFVDLQSKKEESLIEEARRAELIVFSEAEILKTKYATILEMK